MGCANELKLDSGWKLCLIDDCVLTGEISRASQLPQSCIPARVPGDWPLDYVRAGLLDDLYFGDNYLKIRDYETYHVFYTTEFNWGGDIERTCIEFEGIDTVADIYLNGVKIGHSENMFIPHSFNALGLRNGKNELLVHISPVALEARKYPIVAFQSMLKYNYEALVIRKAAHMFGWDICPRIVSSGLWRPVSVVQKKHARICDAMLMVTRICDDHLECAFTYNLDIGRDPMKGYSLHVEGQCGDSRFAIDESLWYIHGRIKRIDIPKPQLWWPRGYGDANQYDITVTLLKNGRELDSFSFKQGLRTVELKCDDTLDKDGSGDFCFIVNGKRVYVKGTNWVPADAFHGSDGERIPKILELVKDIGCNAMRVWGGGVYESDFFYDWCDSNGIMIWQDFMMACGVYPHSERMINQLTEEATKTVRRLRRHACIVLWAGDNECDSATFWGGYRHDPTLNRLTREVLPAVLHAEDWTRPYLPSSPYISGDAYRRGMENHTPEQHLWGPRDYFKGHFYHDANAVFASEMGYHGCNSPASIYRFIGHDNAWPVMGNDMYLYHAASPETDATAPYVYRIALMTRQLKYLFNREPADLSEYAHMSQISQAEAKKYFVECFRSRRPQRTGLIWWNIMDCWPQISDAVVDYYFCRKLAYFFIRRSQAPICLMVDDHTGEKVLYGVNDNTADMRISFEMRDVDTGAVLVSGESLLCAESSTPLYTLRGVSTPRFYSIEWTCLDGSIGSNHYLDGQPPYDYAWYMKCLKSVGYDEFEGFE